MPSGSQKDDFLRDFSRERRLCRSSEFSLVKGKGETFKGRFMILGLLRRETAAADWQVGIIASRKVGGAVERNRVRRRFRELARLDLPRQGGGPCSGRQAEGAGIWLVMVARRAAVTASWEELQREWRKLLGRAEIVPQQHEQHEQPSGGREGGSS